MIHSAHRFHGRSSLRFVYQRGQVVRAPLITLRYVRNDRQSAYRLAVVVSRKVSKSAVVRNRIRRRLYEIVRTHADRIVGPYDLVLNVYSEEVATLSHANLQKTLLGQLTKAGVVKNPPSTEAKHDTIQYVLNNSASETQSPEQNTTRKGEVASLASRRRKGETLSGSPPPSNQKETNN